MDLIEMVLWGDVKRKGHTYRIKNIREMEEFLSTENEEH